MKLCQWLLSRFGGLGPKLRCWISCDIISYFSNSERCFDFSFESHSFILIKI